MVDKKAVYVQQITRVLRGFNPDEVLMEQVDTVPLMSFKSGCYIEIGGHAYRVNISDMTTTTTKKRFIREITVSRSEGIYPNQYALTVTLVSSDHESAVDPVLVNVHGSGRTPIDFTDVAEIINLFKPMLLDQGISLSDYITLYNRERMLEEQVALEKEKILKKEERERIRLIAAAQLEKERQIQRKETPRKKG